MIEDDRGHRKIEGRSKQALPRRQVHSPLAPGSLPVLPPVHFVKIHLGTAYDVPIVVLDPRTPLACKGDSSHLQKLSLRGCKTSKYVATNYKHCGGNWTSERMFWAQ